MENRMSALKKNPKPITPTEIAVLAIRDANVPLCEQWLNGGGAIPAKTITDAARRFGWPCRRVEIELPVSRENQRTTTATVTIVPEAWLKKLAENMQIPWLNACRGIVNPE